VPPLGKGQKNITIKKVFGDKEPKDLSLEECKKAVAGKLKPKTKDIFFAVLDVRAKATVVGFDDAKVVSFTNSARHIE
jgi:hypothetical protein